MARWRCALCGFIYNPPTGDPENGVPPGTPFEKVPEDWTCPECAARKSQFEKFEGGGNKGQTPPIMGDDAAPAKR